MLDRPRHKKIIDELNDLKVNIKLISDSKSTLLNIEGYNLEINERVPLVD